MTTVIHPPLFLSPPFPTLGRDAFASLSPSVSGRTPEGKDVRTYISQIAVRRKKKEKKIIRVDIKGGGSLPQPVLACVRNYTQKGKVASFLRHGIKTGELYVQYVVVQ